MTNKTNHITQRPGYEPRVDSIYVALPGERYTPFSLGKKLGAKAILNRLVLTTAAAVTPR